MNIPNLPVPSHPSQSVIDSTKLQTYQDCPRQFFFEYVLGWRSARPNNHLVFGTAVHKALEHLLINGYNTESVDKAIQAFFYHYRSQFEEYTDQDYWPKTPGRFTEMIIRYLTKYADDHSKYEVLKTEFGGNVHLSDTHLLTFKMDSILRDKSNGQIISLEHKTKQGNYIDKGYSIDHLMGVQCGTYTHVLNTLFEPLEVDGVIINCMCFKRTKSADFIIDRFPIFYTNEQMYIWLEGTKTWLDRLEEDFQKLSIALDSDDTLKAFPCCGRVCTKFGRICSYQTLCMSWPNPLQHLNHMPADMKIDFWNPLDEPLNEILDI